MEITDELRHDIEGAEQLYGQEYPRLRAIADRIDAAYEKAIASVMNDALYHANDEDMAALGWVRLPKVSKESTGKRITDKLREWLDRYTMRKDVYDELLAIADRIDAAHEEAVQREHKSAYDAGYAEHEDEMAEHGWVRLPKDGEAPCKQLSEWIEKRGLVTGPLDANGELWHKGDMSASPWGVIESIAFDGYHWQVCGHDTSAPWLRADSIGHYHAPTVEDVLREMLCACEDTLTSEGVDCIIAEYAAKLRLANSEE